MPEKDVYGVWPRSGEIDIAEARGNDVDYPAGGRDVYTTALHWGQFARSASIPSTESSPGPTSESDAYWRTLGGKAIRRTDYSKGFHTYGMEWSEEYLYFYIDTRLVQVLFLKFNVGQDLWQRGEFSTMYENSSLLDNPWANTGRDNSPFDESFYLILNVAVGARNGFFP